MEIDDESKTHEIEAGMCVSILHELDEQNRHDGEHNERADPGEVQECLRHWRVRKTHEARRAERIPHELKAQAFRLRRPYRARYEQCWRTEVCESPAKRPLCIDVMHQRENWRHELVLCH